MKKLQIKSPKEINSQKIDLFSNYRSNSLRHYRNISSFNYEHRIRLNPLGETKTMDIRNQFPLSHIKKNFIKSEVFTPKDKSIKSAFEKAEMEETITKHITKQKHQNLLRNEKSIRKNCYRQNRLNKKIFQKKKENLKSELTRIIRDAFQFSKKNSAVRAMLPANIDEIVDQVKKETHNLSVNLSLSQVSRISRISNTKLNSIIEKNEFLNSLGIDTENMNYNKINIDIDKCWNYIVKIAKGRNVADILRYKVVNTIMSMTEKKSAEKAKKIYEKLDIYKRYKENKRKQELRRKRNLELNGEEDIKKYIKQKMRKSVTEKKIFINEKNKNDKKDKKDKNYKYGNYKKNNWRKNKQKKRSESVGNINPENDSQGKYMRFNSYDDVNKIISFIDKSRKNSRSRLYRNHFQNIQTTKDMDKTLKNLIIKNEVKFSNN